MPTPKSYSGNGHTVTLADPDNISREECLELARCGAEAWNLWRRNSPVRGTWPGPYKNFADFAGQDFSSEQVHFDNFKFGHQADFSESKFGQGFFAGAEFGHDARFIAAEFGEGTTFECAKFGLEACFDRSMFDADTSFNDCEFDARVSFQNTSFGESISFRGAVFGDGASFDWAHFDHRSSFVGAIFSGSGSFIAASIGFEAEFSGLMAGGSLTFEAAKFEGMTTFRGLSWGEVKQELSLGDASKQLEDRANAWQASPWSFRAISFRGASFAGSINFSDRHFEGATEFSRTWGEVVAPNGLGVPIELASRLRHELVETGLGEMHLPKNRSVRFARAPEFFQCKLHQNTSFQGAEFPRAEGSDDAARAYRALKLAFAQQQATREEQRFFRLEMAEEALMALPLHTWLATWWKQRRQMHTQQVEMPPPRFLYWFYATSSHFGFSIARPLALFFALLALAGAAYGFQADLVFCGLRGVGACNKTASLFQFTIGNALPGFEKFAEPAGKVLFGEQLERLGGWTVLTLLLHKMVSVLALFLAGLALRNLFKMK